VAVSIHALIAYSTVKCVGGHIRKVRCCGSLGATELLAGELTSGDAPAGCCARPGADAGVSAGTSVAVNAGLLGWVRGTGDAVGVARNHQSRY
jgi:hypothetical protein